MNEITSATPSPTSSCSTETSKTVDAEEIPTHNLFNLSLLDPPSYGWTASSGIIHLLEPHEKAKRKSTRKEYVLKVRREKEKEEREREILKEKELKELEMKKEEALILKNQNVEAINIDTVSSMNTIIAAETDEAGANIRVGNSNEANQNEKKRSREQIIEEERINDSHTVQPVMMIQPTSTQIKNPTEHSSTITPSNTIQYLEPTSPSKSNIKTRNQGHKIPSTKGVKNSKRKKRVETLSFSALTFIDSNNEQHINTTDNNQNDEINETFEINCKPVVGKSISTISEETTTTTTTSITATDITTTSTTSNDNQNIHDTTITTNPKPTTTTTTTKIKLDPFIYHRGIENQEPRDKHTGELLCPITEEMDTNHNWESPNLKFTVNVRFPLVDTDHLFLDNNHDHDGRNSTTSSIYGGDNNSDLYNNASISATASFEDKPLSSFDHDNEHDNNTHSESNVNVVRRNARRGNQNKKQTESLLSRRLKREAMIQSLPHFQQNITWDLSNPNSRTPLIYASDIAVEYGLSFHQTLDLARSIQEQIDDYVRLNVNYKIPISATDPFLNPRREGVLQPPEYHVKILYGGHGATNIVSGKKNSFMNNSTDEDDGDINSINEKPKASSKSGKRKSSSSSGNRSKKSSGGGPKNQSGGMRKVHVGGTTVMKYSSKNYEIVPKDQLPKHDIKALPVEQEYVEETLDRLKSHSSETCKAIHGQTNDEGEPLGISYILRNHNCHICHVSNISLVGDSCFLVSLICLSSSIILTSKIHHLNICIDTKTRLCCLSLW